MPVWPCCWWRRVDAETNLNQVGDIVRHGIAHPAVRGVVFQPVTRAGRMPTFDPRTHLTNPDVIKALVDQCPDWFRVSDFFPVPCCFPTCRSITRRVADVIERGDAGYFMLTATKVPL